MIPFPKFLGKKVSITYITKAVLRNFKTNLNSNILLFCRKNNKAHKRSSSIRGEANKGKGF